MRTDITFCLANLMEISVLQNFSKKHFYRKNYNFKKKPQGFYLF